MQRNDSKTNGAGSDEDRKPAFRKGWEQIALRKQRGRQFPNPNPICTEMVLQKQSICPVCGVGSWPETAAHLESRSTPK